MTDQDIIDLQARLADLQKQNDLLTAGKSDAEAKASALATESASKDTALTLAKQQVQSLTADKEAAADDLRNAQEKADELAAAKEAAEQKAANLAIQLKQEIEKDAPLSFEISKDNEDLGVLKGDVFEWTAPLLTWDDNSVIDIKLLAASEDKNDQELYALICASLIQRKSGLIRRKEA